MLGWGERVWEGWVRAKMSFGQRADQLVADKNFGLFGGVDNAGIDSEPSDFMYHVVDHHAAPCPARPSQKVRPVLLRNQPCEDHPAQVPFPPTEERYPKRPSYGPDRTQRARIVPALPL